MTQQDLKQAVISIFIGAAVAFISSFLDGVLQYLRGLDHSSLGGLAATSTYMLGLRRRIL